MYKNFWVQRLSQTFPVMVLSDPKKMETASELTRKHILRLLSDKEMTVTQIAEKLGLSKRTIIYHLQKLLKDNLVILTKQKVNKYGIQEKYYRAAAPLVICELEKSPKKVKDEILESYRNIVIGFLCAKLVATTISDDKLDKIVEIFTKILQRVSKEDGNLGKSRDQIKMKIFRETFKRLEKEEE